MSVFQVLLTTPTTPNERMEEITKVSEGFIYLVSVSISVAVKLYFLILHSSDPQPIICTLDHLN
jgi:hypothetical protein